MMHIQYPDLNSLFRPKSIAVIGASDDVMKPSGLPIKYLRDHGYKGKVYPVNPSHETVQGLRAYHSIGDIPEDIDACVIVIPAALVADAVQECADKGVKVVVICVSGFAELNDEGKKRQYQIEDISKKSGIRICGPNTNGLLNVLEGISLGYSYAQEIVIPGRLGYVSQSGALLSATVPRFTRRGVGMSYFVGAGNQADLEVSDYVRYILDDPNTDVVAVYLEGIKSPSKFLDVATLALAKEKPIVILKIGRSELSTQAAKSHTGSLAGSDAVFDAICKQKGITRADDFSNLVAISSVFLKCKPPGGDGIGIISSSGGAIGLTADHAVEFGLRFPDLSAKTKEEAAKVIPNYGEMRNPFDIAAAGATATQKIELTRAVVKLMFADENIDIVLAIVTPIDRRGTQNYLEALVDGAKSTCKPTIMFCPMGGLREEEEQIVAASNIPIVIDASESVRALKSLIKFGQAVKRYREAQTSPEPQIFLSAGKVKEVLKFGRKNLTEHESKELLAQYGIPVTKEVIAKSSEEACQIACRIGYPVVLKVDSPDISHKTDADALKLKIRDETELLSAYRSVIDNSRKYNANAEIRGVLVQEMTEEGREVILGMYHDLQFGPTIMFGLGGVFVEIFKDISLRLAPLTRYEAEDMIKEIKGYKILESFRGKPAADIDGIIDTLLRLSRLSLDYQSNISEIDINPLMVFGKGHGVKVVDALVFLK